MTINKSSRSTSTLSDFIIYSTGPDHNRGHGFSEVVGTTSEGLEIRALSPPYELFTGTWPDLFEYIEEGLMRFCTRDAAKYRANQKWEELQKGVVSLAPDGESLDEFLEDVWVIADEILGDVREQAAKCLESLVAEGKLERRTCGKYTSYQTPPGLEVLPF